MSLEDQRAVRQRTERLALLKQRAESVLQQHSLATVPKTEQDLATAKLLEELRVYQVELEMQNDELRAAQQTSDLMQRRYLTLFEHMPLPALVVDDHGIVDDCNERAHALLGGLGHTVQPDNRFWNAVDRDDRSRLHAALRDVRSGESVLLAQVQIAKSDTRNAVFDVHLIGLSMDYKLDRRLLLLLVDRTAETAHAADQRFFSLLLDASDSLFYATDLQGKMLLANHTLLRFLGRDRHEVLGHSRVDYMPLQDAIRQSDSDRQVLASGSMLTVEEKVYSRDDGTVDFLTRKFPLRDLQGKLYGVGSISTDITMLKRQQHQGLLSETVFMASLEAIIVTDAQCRILRVNPAFTRLSGFSSEAVIGHHPRILKSGMHPASFYQTMWQAIGKHGHWTGEICNRSTSGQEYNVLTSINAVYEADGSVLYYFAVQTDVTQLRRTQERLAHQASYDDLTDLPNRALFNDRASQLVASAQRNDQPFALLFIDLDRFKEVNDSLGHPVGDRLLCNVANRLGEHLRQVDTVARIGGDEFALLLPDTDRPGAQAVASALLEHLREPLHLTETQQYRPMASVGIAVFPQDGDTPELLLRHADAAMYCAKASGRNRIASYSADQGLADRMDFSIQTELAEAISGQQLRVHFQPKCELGSGKLVGAEALVRWERPGHGLVGPGVFIRLAEKNGLLVAIDQWVMSEVVQQLSRWMRQGLWHSGWRVSVNQNAADLQRPYMAEQLRQLLANHHVPAQALELEITEDAFLQHTPAQLACLAALRAMGVTLAIDDFGTGYSSLSYLRQLPVSVLKIDQSFIATMLQNNNDAMLVRTIIDLAHNLGLTLVAEGVEHAAQSEYLHQLGCELGQGYLFDRPVAPDVFMQRWLTDARTTCDKII
ncbi:MAG: EAL domain-containing protein [Rhodoferax sp.]|uniref:sensor domain-containing protein n=1 Tax=Rhodoferax sp. TaxID=50421 RepID=UPI001B58954A|nr:bifunctional diguanylate cyclase/phosphodiesterase [Rhodoferax sp.]MBP9903996.1 EAL domain-containing protein [Rhodoferax sp.]